MYELLRSLLCLPRTTAVQTKPQADIKLVKMDENDLDDIIRGFTSWSDCIVKYISHAEIWDGIFGDPDSPLWNSNGKSLMGAPVCFKITARDKKQWLVALTQSTETQYKKYIHPHENQQMKILYDLDDIAIGEEKVQNILTEVIKMQLRQIHQNRGELLGKTQKWEFFIAPYIDGHFNYQYGNFRRGNTPYYTAANRRCVSNQAKEYLFPSDCVLTPELSEELKQRWLMINNNQHAATKIMGSVCIRGVPLDYKNPRMEGRISMYQILSNPKYPSLLGELLNRILLLEPGVIPLESDMDRIWTDIYGHSYKNKEPRIYFRSSDDKPAQIAHHTPTPDTTHLGINNIRLTLSDRPR